MVGHLSTGSYNETIIFISVSNHNMIFNWSLVPLWDNILSLDDQVRLCKTAHYVTYFCVQVGCYVARCIMNAVRLWLWMQSRGIGFHCLAGIKQSWQNFVIDLNEL